MIWLASNPVGIATPLGACSGAASIMPIDESGGTPWMALA